MLKAVNVLDGVKIKDTRVQLFPAFVAVLRPSLASCYNPQRFGASHLDHKGS